MSVRTEPAAGDVNAPDAVTCTMSDPHVYVTMAISADMPINVEVSNGLAVLTIGAQARIALEFTDAAALERLGGIAATGIARLMGQCSADPETTTPAGSAR